MKKLLTIILYSFWPLWSLAILMNIAGWLIIVEPGIQWEGVALHIASGALAITAWALDKVRGQ